MHRWPLRPLAEVSENLDALRLPVKEADRKPGPYPYFGASGIVDFVDNFIFDGTYVLVAEDGENLRTRKTPVAFLARGKFWVNNHAHVLQGNGTADTRFLAYALAEADVRSFLTGSTMPKLTRGNLDRIPVSAPPLEEQERIAGLLGALDDKIELNRRMNETLEAVAKTRFARDFHARAGSVVALGDHAEVVRGRSYASADLQASPTALVTLKSFDRGGGYRFDGLKPYVGEYKAEQAVNPGEVVVACTDVTQAAEVIGRSALVQPDPGFETLVASLDVAIVRPKESLNTPFLYFLLRTSDFVDHTYAHTSGTTVLHLSRGAIPSYEFKLPNTSAIEHFGAFAQPLLDRIALNGLESRTLAALRDVLLPKLISGELRIRDASDVGEVAT